MISSAFSSLKTASSEEPRLESTLGCHANEKSKLRIWQHHVPVKWNFFFLFKASLKDCKRCKCVVSKLCSTHVFSEDRDLKPHNIESPQLKFPQLPFQLLWTAADMKPQSIAAAIDFPPQSFGDVTAATFSLLLCSLKGKEAIEKWQSRMHYWTLTHSCRFCSLHNSSASFINILLFV